MAARTRNLSATRPVGTRRQQRSDLCDSTPTHSNPLQPRSPLGTVRRARLLAAASQGTLLRRLSGEVGDEPDEVPDRDRSGDAHGKDARVVVVLLHGLELRRPLGLLRVPLLLLLLL